MGDDDWGDEFIGKPIPRKSQVISQDKNTKYGEFFKFKKSEIRQKTTVSSSLFKFGFEPGSVVGVIGSPKVGKTEYCLQEVIESSRLGYDSLYIINESPKYRFMEIVDSHLKEMKYSEHDVEHVSFLDMHGMTLGSANYATIESYINSYWVKRLEEWLLGARNPRFVVLDSISKIGRKYIPQMFYMTETLYKGIVETCKKYNKYPVFLIVNQKSGGYFEQYDDSVVGGHGIMHEFDGKILFMRRRVDQRLSQQTSLPMGSRIYTVEMDLRSGECLSDETIVFKDGGKLKLGPTLSDYVHKTFNSVSNRDGQSEW